MTARILRRSPDPLLLATLAGLVVLSAVFVASPRLFAAEEPRDRLLVADLRGHALVLVEAGSVTGRIRLPGGPHEFARLDDGRFAVSLEQYGTVVLVDVETGVVQAHEIGGFPHGLDIAGDVLHVTDRASSAVRRFALEPWVELAAVPAGEWPHATRVLSEGRVAVANARSNTLQIGDVHLPVSQLPETVAVSPDGDRLATAGAYGGAVEVYDLDGRLLDRWVVGGKPVRVEYGPDGTLAAALAEAGAVAVINSSGEVRVIETGGVPDGLAFSPGGERLYVGDIHGGVVSAIHLARNEVISRVAVGESAGAVVVLE